MTVRPRTSSRGPWAPAWRGWTRPILVAGSWSDPAGVPLWRASIGADTLHPLIVAQGHRWLAGEGVEEEFYARSSNPEADQEWRRSPWYQLVTSGESQMRRRLAAGEGSNEFPLLAGWPPRAARTIGRAIVPFGDQRPIGETRGLATSWATRDPRGSASGIWP